MKIEHINENTIRVLLGNDDLNARGITVLDLLGSHKQIQDFFYSILDEVDTNHEFRDNEAVTFQVLPTQTGLELFISKADPDSNDGNDNNAAISKYIKREMAARDQMPENNDNSDRHDENNLSTSEQEFNSQTALLRVVKFNSFEDLISVSRLVEPLDQMASDLYKLDDQYFLVMTFYNDGTLLASMVDDILAILSEYAIQTAITADVVEEHGQLLIPHTALERLRYYFK